MPEPTLANWLDAALAGYLLRARRLAWRGPARAVTALGETPLIVSLLIATPPRQPRTAATDIGVLALALGARAALAQAVRRRRPDPAQWWGQPTGFSMPSRHTMTAALGLSLLADRVPGSHRANAHRAAHALAAGVGLSRVVLGLHWPTDVVAGYALGVAAHLAVSRARVDRP